MIEKILALVLMYFMFVYMSSMQVPQLPGLTEPTDPPDPTNVDCNSIKEKNLCTNTESCRWSQMGIEGKSSLKCLNPSDTARDASDTTDSSPVTVTTVLTEAVTSPGALPPPGSSGGMIVEDNSTPESRGEMGCEHCSLFDFGCQYNCRYVYI